MPLSLAVPSRWRDGQDCAQGAGKIEPLRDRFYPEISLQPGNVWRGPRLRLALVYMLTLT